MASDVLRLLIVEDEISTTFAMRTFFTHYGYQVDCASSPTDARILIDRNRYDAAIIDLHLTSSRRREGLGVLSHARTQNPRGVIIMLTAYSSDVTAREARGIGVDLYETKPVRLEDLASSIETARHARLDGISLEK